MSEFTMLVTLWPIWQSGNLWQAPFFIKQLIFPWPIPPPSFLTINRHILPNSSIGNHGHPFSDFHRRRDVGSMIAESKLPCTVYTYVGLYVGIKTYISSLELENGGVGNTHLFTSALIFSSKIYLLLYLLDYQLYTIIRYHIHHHLYQLSRADFATIEFLKDVEFSPSDHAHIHYLRLPNSATSTVLAHF